MKKLGQYLVEALEELGVRHVFGIPGVHNLELYRGLARSSIRHVNGRHEQALGFMADGYARASGSPGVCFTISGPGLTNIATAMGQAYGDSIPMLVISSQNRAADAGSGAGFLHELKDQYALASGVAGLSFAIRSPGELPTALGKAFASFESGRPRPVYIEVPLDVLAAEADRLPLPEVVRRRPRAAPAQLESAATLLRSAQRPVLLAGGGGIRAAVKIRHLAERLDAPVVMTANGRGILPHGHPLAVPMSPMLAPVRTLIAEADTVLAIGTEIGPTDYSMDLREDFPTPANLIRIDIDEEQIIRGAEPKVALCGDAGETLDALDELDMGALRHGEGAARASAVRCAALDAVRVFSPALREHLGTLEVIRRALPSALWVGDSTQMVYAGNLAFNVDGPGQWFNSATGYGTLGYALPASSGASLGKPDQPVICLTGDGGLQFTLSELAALNEVNAWTALIIFNNFGYGEIRTSMRNAGIEPEGVDVKPPDFSLIARAYGLNYRRVASCDTLANALQVFGSSRQSLVIEIFADEFN